MALGGIKRAFAGLTAKGLAARLVLSAALSVGPLVFYLLVVKGGIRPEDFPELVGRAGWWGKAAYLAVYTVSAGLVLPIPLFLAGSGFLFGVWGGFAVAVIGTTACAVAGYLYGRYLFRDFYRAAFGGIAERVDALVVRRGFAALFWWRLMFLPWTPVNFGCGAAGMGLSSYAQATLLGNLPPSFIWVYTGGRATAALDALRAGELTHPAVIGPALLLLVTAAGPYIMKKLFSREEEGKKEQ